MTGLDVALSAGRVCFSGPSGESGVPASQTTVGLSASTPRVVTMGSSGQVLSAVKQVRESILQPLPTDEYEHSHLRELQNTDLRDGDLER